MRFSSGVLLHANGAWAIGFTRYRNQAVEIDFLTTHPWHKIAGKVRVMWAMTGTTFQYGDNVEQSLAQARMETESREVLSSDRGC